MSASSNPALERLDLLFKTNAHTTGQHLLAIAAFREACMAGDGAAVQQWLSSYHFSACAKTNEIAKEVYALEDAAGASRPDAAKVLIDHRFVPRGKRHDIPALLLKNGRVDLFCEAVASGMNPLAIRYYNKTIFGEIGILSIANQHRLREVLFAWANKSKSVHKREECALAVISSLANYRPQDPGFFLPEWFVGLDNSFQQNQLAYMVGSIPSQMVECVFDCAAQGRLGQEGLTLMDRVRMCKHTQRRPQLTMPQLEALWTRALLRASTPVSTPAHRAGLARSMPMTAGL